MSDTLEYMGKFHINGYDDRQSFIMALNNSGYATAVQVIEGELSRPNEYWVIVYNRRES